MLFTLPSETLLTLVAFLLAFGFLPNSSTGIFIISPRKYSNKLYPHHFLIFWEIIPPPFSAYYFLEMFSVLQLLWKVQAKMPAENLLPWLNLFSWIEHITMQIIVQLVLETRSYQNTVCRCLFKTANPVHPANWRIVQVHDSTFIFMGFVGKVSLKKKPRKCLKTIFFTASKSSKLLRGLQGKTTFSTRMFFVFSSCFIYFILVASNFFSACSAGGVTLEKKTFVIILSNSKFSASSFFLYFSISERIFLNSDFWNFIVCQRFRNQVSNWVGLYLNQSFLFLLSEFFSKSVFQ